ncbi:DUF6233 domain-containing protein [Streptomyces sp. NPDC006393]|uniref:DUF6233 domain-containing protein n=1 Tax=Streptomyces sp. NPDC006393 TaxID=3156763 RepID=UPI0033F1A28D
MPVKGSWQRRWTWRWVIKQTVHASLRDRRGAAGSGPSRRARHEGPAYAFRPGAMSSGSGRTDQWPREPRPASPPSSTWSDCTMIEGTPHRIRTDEARAVLTGPDIEPCPFRRPGTGLGILE